MEHQTPIAWLNGKLMPFEQMSLPVWDLGVVAGASISEMARTYRHVPFRATEHLQRLFDSCDELGFQSPWSAEVLENAAGDLVEANAKDISSGEDLGIVWFVTAGANRTYLGTGDVPGPSVGIHTFRLPFELWQVGMQDGVRLRIPHRVQISTDSLPVHRKTRNRLHWWLADREAAAMDPGSRALLLDDRGCLTETSTAAFFGVIDGEIVTSRNNVLQSLSREMVREAAKALKVPFRFTDLSAADTRRMSEAFLSSTPFGLMPVQAIDGHRLAPVHGKVMTELLRWWSTTTGIDPQNQILKNASG